MMVLDLDQKFDHRIYSYERANGNKCVVLQGISAVLCGNYQVTIDSQLNRNQTVVIARGEDYEIVIELRPRRLTEAERCKIKP